MAKTPERHRRPRRVVAALLAIVVLTPVLLWWSLPYLAAWGTPWLAGRLGLDAMTPQVDTSAERVPSRGFVGEDLHTRNGPFARVSPLLALQAQRAGDRLLVAAEANLQGEALDLLLGLLGLPPGSGSLRGHAHARLPWPPAGVFDWRAIDADGQVDLHWQPDGAAWRIGPLAGTWRTRAAPWQITGTVTAGGLGPLDWQLQYHPDNAVARGTLVGAVQVDRPLFAELLQGWAASWDLDAGRLRVDAEFAWAGAAAAATAQRSDPGLQGLQARVVVDLQEGEARYDRFRLHGLAGTLPLRLAGGAWHFGPTELTMARLDAGLWLEQVQTRIEATAETVTLGPVAARVAGGLVTVAPFDYDRSRASAELAVTVADVDLAELLGLYGAQIAGTGRLDGHLPASVAAGALSIHGGRLLARAPGGQIRLAPALARAAARPGLDFALRALEDFSYTLLDADVDYAPSGDLTLAVRLHGRNPEIERGRPIHYNLTVTENVPQLLESLTLEGRLLEHLQRRVRD